MCQCVCVVFTSVFVCYGGCVIVCVFPFFVVGGHWKKVDGHVTYVARVVAIHEGQTAERPSPSM